MAAATDMVEVVTGVEVDAATVEATAMVTVIALAPATKAMAMAIPDMAMVTVPDME